MNSERFMPSLSSSVHTGYLLKVPLMLTTTGTGILLTVDVC